jgi:uncharacterized protein YaaW (UPF0174 family)
MGNPITREDITKLLSATSPDEQKQLSELLEMNGISDANSLVVELWWKYQTPFGFVVRDPSFDDICRDIAKKMKLHGLIREKDSCWDLLRKIIGNLIDKMLEDLPPEKREEALRELLDEKEIDRLKKTVGGDVAKLVSGGASIWVGTLSYQALRNLLLRVIHGLIRAILGRGLSYAAAQKVLGVVAKRAPVLGILAGPVGWILTIWGINDLMGTNYKRVIPAVLFIYSIYINLKADGRCPIE